MRFVHLARRSRAPLVWSLVASMAAASLGACSAPAAPSPTPAPTPAVSGEKVLNAFETRFARSRIPYHATLSGTATFSGKGVSFTVKIRGEWDAIGADSKGKITVTGAGQRSTTEMVTLSGKHYERVNGRRWTRAARSGSVGWDFGSSDVRYVRAVTRRGTTLHQLRPTDFAWNIPSGGQMRIRKSDFDLFTKADGTPVEAVLVATGTARFEKLTLGMDTKLTFTFSNFGKKVTIKAPPIR